MQQLKELNKLRKTLKKKEKEIAAIAAINSCYLKHNAAKKERKKIEKQIFNLIETL